MRLFELRSLNKTILNINLLNKTSNYAVYQSIRFLANDVSMRRRNTMESKPPSGIPNNMNKQILNCDATLNFLLENAIIQRNTTLINDILHCLVKKPIHPRLLMDLKLANIPLDKNCSEIIDAKLQNISTNHIQIDRFLSTIIELTNKNKSSSSVNELSAEQLFSLQDDARLIRSDWLHPKYWLMFVKNLPLEFANPWKKSIFNEYINQFDLSNDSTLISKFYKTWYNTALKRSHFNETDLTSKLNLDFSLDQCTIAIDGIIQNSYLLTNGAIDKVPHLQHTRSKMVDHLRTRMKDALKQNPPQNMLYMMTTEQDLLNISHLTSNCLLHSARKATFVVGFSDELLKMLSNNIEQYYFFKWRTYYQMRKVVEVVNKHYSLTNINQEQELPRLMWVKSLCDTFGCNQLIEPIPMPVLVRYDMANCLRTLCFDIFIEGDMKILYNKERSKNKKTPKISPTNELQQSFNELGTIETAGKSENASDLRFQTIAHQKISSLKSSKQQSTELPLHYNPIFLGYSSQSFSDNFKPFIKTTGSTEYYNKLQRSSSNEHNHNHIFPVLDTITKLNSTSLSLSRNVLDIIQQYLLNPKEFKFIEKKNKKVTPRQKNCEIVSYFLNKPFYQRHEIDFRGRCYPTIDLNSFLDYDMLNGLIRFSKKKPLGEIGLKWLKILYTSLALDESDRNADEKQLCDYCDENLPLIKKTVHNPMKKDWWQLRPHPWKLLAVCHEIVNAKNNPNYQSGLPIFFDGSCNMFQHLAAFCNDSNLQNHVHFSQSTKSSSSLTIYDHLCELALKTINMRTNLIDFKMLFNRKFFKNILLKSMQEDCDYAISMYIKSHFTEEINEKYDVVIDELSGKLKRLVYDSMPTVFQFKEWLLEATQQLAKSNNGIIEWKNPLDFPISQSYYVINSLFSYPANLHPNAACKVTKNANNITPNVKKHKDSIIYNLVHSLDASHMMLITLNCIYKDIELIQKHESFGSHLCDGDILNNIIRSQFVKMYNEVPAKKFVNDLASIRCNKTSKEILDPAFVQKCPIPNSMFVGESIIIICILEPPQNLDSIMGSYKFFDC